MLALHEVQTEFRRAILTGDTDTFCALVAADGLAPEERLGVYRNNVFASQRLSLQHRATGDLSCDRAEREQINTLLQRRSECDFSPLRLIIHNELFLRLIVFRVHAI